MYIYKSKTDKTFCVFDHTERDTIKNKIQELEDRLIDISDNGQVREYNINQYDMNALDWLYKLCWNHEFETAEALDPSLKQITTFIDPLIKKVYNITFMDWLNLQHTGTFTLEDMTRFMSEKRREMMKKDIEYYGPDYIPF